MGHNMRITDLLDKNSISLNAAPADKKETLDLAAVGHIKRCDRNVCESTADLYDSAPPGM